LGFSSSGFGLFVGKKRLSVEGSKVPILSRAARGGLRVSGEPAAMPQTGVARGARANLVPMRACRAMYAAGVCSDQYESAH